MVRKSSIIVVVLAGVWLSGSCRTYDLVEPNRRARPAAVFVDAIIRHGLLTTTRLVIRIDAGADESGRSPGPVPLAIRIDGVVLPSSSTPASGIAVYVWEDTLATDHAMDALRLSIPPFAHTQIVDVSIPLAAREDSLRLSINEGQDLALAIPIPQSDSLIAPIFWNLSLVTGNSCSQATAPLVRISGRALREPRMQLPWNWFRTPAPATIAGCFDSTAGYTPVGTPYQVSIALRVEADWTIEIKAGTSALTGTQWPTEGHNGRFKLHN